MDWDRILAETLIDPHFHRIVCTTPSDHPGVSCEDLHDFDEICYRMDCEE